MQNWQSELEAQNQHGRSQLGYEINGNSVSNRPFGSVPEYQNGYPKPRQFGGDRRYPNANNRVQGGYEGGEKPRVVGHLAFLKSLQRSEATIRILTIHDEVVIGTVKDCDEMTISLRVPCATSDNPDAYQNRVFFKQNLVEFAPVIEGVTFS